VTDNRGSLAPDRQIGRFTLIDLVEDRYGAQVWRAVDGTLNREVALWILARDADLEADLEQSTRTAATVADRRIVHILDVFTTESELVVVTEWAEGQVLRDHLHEPLPPAEAARIAFEVAGGLESAHAAGIVHGRLRPGNVLICHDGEVRITGLGIDAVLAGIDEVSDGNPITADVNGVGSILYAGLTGRWPTGPVEGIPAAPEVGGHVPPPSRLLADIPESLNDVCARSVQAVVPLRGRPALTTVGQAREALGASLTDLTGERRAYVPPEEDSRTTSLARIAVAVAVLLLVVAGGWLVLRMFAGEDEVAAPEPTPTPTEPSAPTASEKPEPKVYRITDARDFDPLGNGEENPGRVPFAYDGDSNTVWRTVTYYNKSLDKPGVGMLLDLGAPRSIGSVNLDLVGNGTDLQVLTSNDPGTDPQDYQLMAQATEAGENVTLKNPDPVSARYVLVWMTGLPQVDGGWRGGIREVAVTS
jgi:putative peptidoglycan lipid II flippase